jgi:hypothetical protein
MECKILQSDALLVAAANDEPLQPVHPGTIMFSPSNIHHCTVPLDFVSRDPLLRPILMLAQFLKQKCGGYCTIAGGGSTCQVSVRSQGLFRLLCHQVLSRGCLNAIAGGQRKAINIFSTNKSK